MRGDRVWLLIFGLALLGCALAACVFVNARREDAAGEGSPIAVVLVPGLSGSDLVSVDLDTGRATGRARLRSLATDIAADPARGVVVAAQTGGVETDADDALSITDPRSGAVDYVTLPQRDPSQVECLSGRALVLHAVVESSGFVVDVVDIASRATATTAHVPDGTGMWAAAAGSVWTAVATDGPVPFAFLRVDPATLRTTSAPALDFCPHAAVSAGDAVLVVGAAGTGPRTQARVALLDATGASVIASATVPGLAHAAELATVVGETVVIGDWSGEEPETASLQVLDRATLAPIGAISAGGAPCAIASYAGSLLVVDRLSGTLAKVDPRSGRVAWRADLGARDLVCSQVVVLPGRP